MLKEWIFQIHGQIFFDDCLLLQLLPETTIQIRKTLQAPKDKSE